MLVEAFRRRAVGQVRNLFNDGAKGEAPVQPSDDALLPRGSVAWRVHGDVMTMMVGGISGLLLEMLHPAALAGVWDHSNFRRDMVGRLRRTARFIAQTTYAERAEAEAAIARVNKIHAQVTGVMPEGSVYRADDPHLLAWIHVASATSFLNAWIRYAEPGMSRRDQDAYFAEVYGIARRLGVDPVPETRAAANALIEEYRTELSSTDRSREVARIILNPPAASLRAIPMQKVMGQAAIDLLPSWARAMHGLNGSALGRPAVDAVTFGLASTVRWAFAGEGRR